MRDFCVPENRLCKQQEQKQSVDGVCCGSLFTFLVRRNRLLKITEKEIALLHKTHINDLTIRNRKRTELSSPKPCTHTLTLIAIK